MTTINFMNSLATANLTNEANDRYQMVMQNVQKIGNKYFATIFADMLVFDMSYQRNDMIRASKIKALAENWEDALCDPIKVSPHSEYPMRKAKAVRMTLVIEDHLHKAIGCPYTYTKKQGIGVAKI